MIFLKTSFSTRARSTDSKNKGLHKPLFTCEENQKNSCIRGINLRGLALVFQPHLQKKDRTNQDFRLPKDHGGVPQPIGISIIMCVVFKKHNQGFCSHKIFHSVVFFFFRSFPAEKKKLWTTLLRKDSLEKRNPSEKRVSPLSRKGKAGHFFFNLIN